MKLLAFLDLFRKGSAVADPATWKNRTALTLALTGLLVALNKLAVSYGYDFGLSDMDVGSVAAAVAVVVGLFGNYATSDKVGVLPPKPEADPAPAADPGPSEQPVQQLPPDAP